MSSLQQGQAGIQCLSYSLHTSVVKRFACNSVHLPAIQTQAYTTLCQESGPMAVRSLNQPHANLQMHLARSAVRGHAGLPWTTRQCLNALVHFVKQAALGTRHRHQAFKFYVIASCNTMVLKNVMPSNLMQTTLSAHIAHSVNIWPCVKVPAMDATPL